MPMERYVFFVAFGWSGSLVVNCTHRRWHQKKKVNRNHRWVWMKWCEKWSDCFFFIAVNGNLECFFPHSANKVIWNGYVSNLAKNEYMFSMVKNGHTSFNANGFHNWALKWARYSKIGRDRSKRRKTERKQMSGRERGIAIESRQISNKKHCDAVQKNGSHRYGLCAGLK